MSRKNDDGGAPNPPKDKPTSPEPAGTPSAPDTPSKLAGWKLWRFRLAAAVGVPLFLLVTAELALRVFGYGYPTHFFRPYSQDGKEMVVQNNQFGWRFFGPAMSRQPDSFIFPRVKGPRTIRIFVFGESAAFGDPQSQFGLPRMLEALLELRHPGVKFEVINAAMTGIDSNVILPIAKDCAHADGDVWVVYMGNNEVVGPYGAGTVFGPQAPPVWEIRASLALKALRLGQVFDTLGRRLHPPPSSKSEWGGMEMFLDQQVRADDPRMNHVYENFERNLADIIKEGTSHGAGVVVSTVAVNLKDSAPFASAHRPDLSAADREKWEALYQKGIEHQRNQEWQAAIDTFAQAAQIDDHYAELRFRQGMCAAAFTNVPEMQKQFTAARDLDTLRFRCDSKLNEIIRRLAPTNGTGRVTLADAEGEFAARSAGGLPGDGLFYEHVHLTFVGNYLLARTIAPQVEKFLPTNLVATATTEPWPTGNDCIKRLAWDDWSFQKANTEILQRLHDPPFINQISHLYELQNLDKIVSDLMQATLFGQMTNGMQSPLVSSGITACQTALANWPDDARIYEQLAALKQEANDLPGAAEAAKRAVQLLPSSGEDWSQLGLIQGQSGNYADAAESFKKAVNLDPEDVWSLFNLGHACEKMKRPADAEHAYRQAVETKPRFGPAWQALGALVEARGDKAGAEADYRLAITNRIHRNPELVNLAHFCRDRGWTDDAVKIFDEAAKISPADKSIPYEAGLIELKAVEKAHAAGAADAEAAYRIAAARHFDRVTQIDPRFMPAHYEYGMVTLDPNISVREFGIAAQLDPSQSATHLNLAMALERTGRTNEAAAEYQTVLNGDPAKTPDQLKAMAREHLLKLRPGSGSSPDK